MPHSFRYLITYLMYRPDPLSNLITGLPGNTLAKLRPKVGDVEVLNTSSTGMHMRALVNITNPTPYTAVIPYFNIHILNSGHVLGEATATNVKFSLGENINIPVDAVWDPLHFGGRQAHHVGRRLLSEYISGENTTLTATTHRGTVPNVPLIGEALSKINITMPTPRIRIPGEDKDSEQRFIKDATFHIFSSSAAFTLLSPLQYNTIYLEYINATAFYNHTEPVGQIIYKEPLAVTPGRSETPRLPVNWSVGSVGYGKLKEALGGSLKLDAVADVTIRMGNWIEEIHYIGKGIGARVTF